MLPKLRTYGSNTVIGRGAFHNRYTPDREDWYRVMEETLPARVAINRVRIPVAENLRFPGEGSSAQG